MITATFSELLDPATINSSTFELRNSGGALVPATISYVSVTGAALLQPLAPLAESTTFTATLKGGSVDPRPTSE